MSNQWPPSRSQSLRLRKFKFSLNPRSWHNLYFLLFRASENLKGKYNLKPEFYSEYNVFFYRFSRENQSKSEEAQRQRRRAAGEPECNPPPLPPALSDQFLPLVKIMESDVFLHLLSLVLKRADNLRSRCFSENQVHQVLHVIGMCLLEEQRLKTRNYLAFTAKATEKYDMYNLLKALVDSQRIESHKHLLQWTISLWEKVAGIEAKMAEASGGGLDVEMTSSSDKTGSRKSPLPAATSGPDAKDLERKRLAAERRKKVMEQMKNAQKNFMKENKAMFDDSSNSDKKRPRLNTEESTSNLEAAATATSTTVKCLGPERSEPAITESRYTCILCQEEEDLEANGKALVMAAFVQKSTVLSNRGSATGPTLTSNPMEGFPFLASDLHCSTHASSCSHVMHSTCWMNYFNDIVNSERNRSRLRSPQSFNVSKSEYLCPLCRSLCNTLIPLIPQFHLLQPLKPAAAHGVNPDDEDAMVVQDIETSNADSDTATMKPIRLPFDQWLDGVIITDKYKKILDSSKIETVAAKPSEGGENSPNEAAVEHVRNGKSITCFHDFFCEK